MAQKDKVKELVGRGLDTYHTKVLQQIERIEKKNEEQNHKINILTNELDMNISPIAKATRLNKTEVLNNTNDINDNIVPYLMDMDYRVVCLQLEGRIENVSMARLFSGTFEMLQRDVLSNRYSKEEYKYRLDAYLSANKITEDEYNKLGDMLNE